MSKRPQAHVVRRPGSYAFVLEQLGSRHGGLDRAQAFEVERAVQRRARDPDDVPRLGTRNLEASQLSRRGNGQRRRLREGAVVAAFVFDALPVSVDQSLLHLVGEGQVDLLLENG